MDGVITDVDDAVVALASDDEVSFDLETGGLDPWTDPIAVVTMNGKASGKTALLHVRGTLGDHLVDFMSESGRLWIGHNAAGFDIPFLALNGVDYIGPSYYDTMIGEQVAVSSGRRDIRVNLQDTVARRLGVRLRKGEAKSTWMAASLTPAQVRYCVEDVKFLHQVRRAQLDKVEGTSQARAMEFEQGMVPLVVQMVLNGLPIDLDMLRRWLGEQEVRAVEAYRLIDSTLGHVNVNSGKQIIEAYARVFNLRLPSSDAETMTPLEERDDEVGRVTKAVVTARKAKKRVNMYDDEWIGKHVTGGRVHARFWTCSTDTSRFSSTDPNLQQIPVDGRKIFGGVPGYKVVSVDYAQLEVHIAASMANDKAMIRALSSGDIHTAVASEIFQVPPAAVTKEQRKLAKATTFTLLFGGTANGLVFNARMAGAHLEDWEAKRIVRQFFEVYQGLAVARRRAQDLGASGRPVPIVLSSGFRRVLVPSGGGVSPPQILNTNVQGNAAVGLKRALMYMDEWGILSYVSAVVHDEVVAVVPDAEVEMVKRYIEEAMVKGMGHVIPNCPVRVESKVGYHWSYDDLRPEEWLRTTKYDGVHIVDKSGGWTPEEWPLHVVEAEFKERLGRCVYVGTLEAQLGL